MITKVIVTATPRTAVGQPPQDEEILINEEVAAYSESHAILLVGARNADAINTTLKTDVLKTTFVKVAA